MPPLGESGCAGVAARATIAPTLLREGDMEKVGEEGTYQTLWPNVLYGTFRLTLPTPND